MLEDDFSGIIFPCLIFFLALISDLFVFLIGFCKLISRVFSLFSSTLRLKSYYFYPFFPSKYYSFFFPTSLLYLSVSFESSIFSVIGCS